MRKILHFEILTMFAHYITVVFQASKRNLVFDDMGPLKHRAYWPTAL